MAREFLVDVNLKAGLSLDGSAGETDRVLVSKGSGQKPAWGFKVTASTLDPTGGVDGDIWIKYTA
jgi:hypothetical protein